MQGQDVLWQSHADGHFGTSAWALEREAVDPARSGANGLATANFGGDDDADSLVIQSSGQIIAIGTTLQNGVAQTAVAAHSIRRAT